MVGAHPDLTVRQALDRWVEACRRGRDGRYPVEPTTLMQYEAHRDLHIAPRIGDIKLADLRNQHCREFRDRLVAELSRPMAKKVWTSFKGALSEAQAAGLMVHNPTAALNVAVGMRHKKRIVIPSRDQARTLLSKAVELRASSHPQIAMAWRRYCPIVHLVMFTGMRMGEIRGLPWSNVDLENLVIRVRQRADRLGRIGPPKSEAGIRDIRIPFDIALMLKQWRLVCPNSARDLVFPTGSGLPENNSNILSRCWFPLQKAAGLLDGDGRPLFNAKDMRHFRASLLIDRGATPKELQTAMGHSSIQLTYDVYGHLFEDREQHTKDRERVEGIAKDLL